MKRYYKINQFINAAQIRLIGPDNKQIGVVTKEEALKMARDAEMDLVAVAENAKPPVCKIIEFKKFKYQEQRKERQAKKGVKRVDTKQIMYTPFIAENDYKVGVNRALRWFKEGNRVKVIVKFVGRQITKRDFGFNLINRFAKEVETVAKMEVVPKFERRMLGTTFSPVQIK